MMNKYESTKDKRIRETINKYQKMRSSKLAWLAVNYGIILITLFTVIIPIIMVFVVINLHKERDHLQRCIDDLELRLLE